MPDRTLKGNGTAVLGSRRILRSDRKRLGIIHDQNFFAQRHLPGKDLTLPFTDTTFNALLHLTVPLAEDTLRQIALFLLQNGMRLGVCQGQEAERMGEIIDELTDEFGFSHEGRTVYASVHDDETLEDVLEYFILPNGLATTSLILVLGNEAEFRAALRSFNEVTGELREKIFTETVSI